MEITFLYVLLTVKLTTVMNEQNVLVAKEQEVTIWI